MPELPASWNLKTRKRGTKVDVIGKDAQGKEYKVRTCEGGVKESDLAAIRECDRENYRSREDGARSYVQGVVDAGKSFRDNQDRRFQEELEELAGPVVHAGLERKGSTAGYSPKYAANYEKVFGGD